MADSLKTRAPMADDAGEASDRLAVSDLACERGERELFSRVSFEVPDGHALVVTGPNGSGKSSLLRILAGLLPPTAGSCRRPTRGSFTHPIGYLGHANAVKVRLTVQENLHFWAELLGAAMGVAPALEQVGLREFAKLPAGWLSAGQLRRLALARLLIADARVWLLDEPGANLDASGETVLQAELARHRARGGSAVITAPTDFPMVDSARLVLGGS